MASARVFSSDGQVAQFTLFTSDTARRVTWPAEEEEGVRVSVLLIGRFFKESTGQQFAISRI